MFGTNTTEKRAPDSASFDRSFLPVIEDACRTHAGDVCLVFKDESYTYGEVGELSARIANALRDADFVKGMKGAVYSLNSAITFIAALGILRAGGVWIPVNPRNSEADNVDVLAKFHCDALFFQVRFATTAAEIDARLGGLKAHVSLDGELECVSSLDGFIDASSSEPPRIAMEGKNTLILPMTGGTTGLPKGVMLSHRNFCAIDYAMTQGYAGRRPVVLCAAPMTHVTGRSALTSMTSGARFVILEKVDPQIILQTIEKERVTDLFLPPTAIYALLDQPNINDFDLSSLETLGYGSAPMSVAKIREAIDVLGPVMRGGFGQTECPMFISRLAQEEHFLGRELGGQVVSDQRLRSVGRATLLSELAIMDDEGNLLPPGERGEIVVKGPMVSEGYYEEPAETATIRKNGWHLTGDIGYLDEEGYLYIVDRKKDMIITGGFNVYSAEVELVLMSMPDVKVAVVIGIPSEKWGEEVRALIVREAQSDTTAEEIIVRAKERLGGVKAPKSVELVDELPRTAIGKIDKKALREPYWLDHERRV